MDSWFSLAVETLSAAPADWTPEGIATALRARLLDDPSGSTPYRREMRVVADALTDGVRGRAATGGGNWRNISFAIEPSRRVVTLDLVRRVVGRPEDELDVLPPQVAGVRRRWRVAGGMLWARTQLDADVVTELGLDSRSRP